MAPKRAQQHLFSRRTFLKTVGIATGALAAAPLFEATPTAAASRAVKAAPSVIKSDKPLASVGLVLPPGSAAAAFQAGWQLYGSANSVQLVPMALEGRAPSQLDALLRKPTWDVLVAVSSRTSVLSQAASLAQSQRCCLITNMDGVVLRTGEAHPQIIDNTLPVWQAAWASGYWAAQHGGRRALLVQSAYEAGYDGPYAFGCGFAAGGGQVVATVTTHTPGQPEDGRAFSDALRTQQPDVVYASYSRAAADFASWWQAQRWDKAPLLIGSAGLLDAALNSAIALPDFFTGLAWSPLATSRSDQAFMRAYTDAYGHAPAPWALLGYATAGRIHSAAKLLGGDWSRQTTQQALAQAQTPLVRLGSTDQALSVGLHRYRLGKTGPQLTIEESITVAPGGDSQIVALTQQPRTGWLDLYGSDAF